MIFFLVLVSFFTTFWAWKAGFFSLPKVHSNPSFPIGLLLIAALIYASVLVTVALTFPFWRLSSTFPRLLFGNDLFIIAGASSLMLFLLKMQVSFRKHILGPKNRIFSSLYYGTIGCVVAYPWTLLVGQLVIFMKNLVGVQVEGKQLAVSLLEQAQGVSWLFWGTLVLIVFVVPFIEEFLFRGLVHNWLRNYFGRDKVIVITSLLFGLAHFSVKQGGANWEIVLSLSVFSLILDFVYEKEKTLLAPYWTHACFNACSATLLVI